MSLDIGGLRIGRSHLLLAAVRSRIDIALGRDMQRAVKEPTPKNLSRSGKCIQCFSRTHDSITVSGNCARTVSSCRRCGLVAIWDGGPGVGVNEGTYWVRLEEGP